MRPFKKEAVIACVEIIKCKIYKNHSALRDTSFQKGIQNFNYLILHPLSPLYNNKKSSIASNWNLSAIKKFNRFELKYLILYDIAQKLQEDLKNYVIPES